RRAGRDRDLSAAASAGGQGSGRRLDAYLRAIPVDPALAANRDAGAGPRAPAIRGRAREARRAVGMYFVLLLHHGLPELLVAGRALSRPGGAAPGGALARGQPRRKDRRAPRPARRP